MFRFKLLALIALGAPATTLPLLHAQTSASPAQIESLTNAGKYAEAQRDLDPLLKAQPIAPGTWRLEGMLAYQQADMTKADEAFRKAIEQDPADQVAVEMRGMTLFRTGRPAEAIPLLEKANGWLPAVNADANYVLGLCYMQTRRYDDARKSFAAMLKFPPDSADAYLLAARLYFRFEFVPVAEESAHKALELKPTLPLAHQLLGEVALAKQDYAAAQSEFEKERDLNPLNPAVYDRLGDTYLRQQKYDEAQRSLNRSILLDPYSSGPVLLLGKVMLKQGDAAMAANFLQRATHMDPNNFIAHNLLGQAYRALGRPEDAGKESEIATRLQNTGPEKKAEGK